jgi:hypothetical protein
MPESHCGKYKHGISKNISMQMKQNYFGHKIFFSLRY